VPGYDELLFATGDCQVWLITTKNAIGGPFNGEYYGSQKRQILKSSINANPYTAEWLNRRERPEDPWISVIDHGSAISAGMLVYGENGGSTHLASRTQVLVDHNGANVFIRKRNGIAGNILASTCATCVAGKYAAAAGSTVCTSCVPGQYSGTASTVCTDCPPGKYSGAAATVCTDTTARHVVKFAVSLPMTEASFTTDKQDLFKKSIATAAAVSVADVNIDKIATIIGGRRLLAESIRVDTRVTASSEAAAKAIARALTADKMNAELSKNNLPKATFLEAPKVSPLQAQDEKKKDAGSGGGVLLAGILVPVLVFVVVSMACCCWCWCKRQAPPPT
jgi:hypothetical protein